MLRDEGFSSRAKVDRYGRKLPKDAGKKELERYYSLGDEDEEGQDGELDNDREVELELERANARDTEMSTSSSEESSSDDDDSEDVEEDEVFGFPEEQGGDGDSVPMGEPSVRLAVVNLDWDNIRAADLMAVFSSFTPGNGRILKISIYPSEFGKERMEKEEMEGPPKEVFAQKKSESRPENLSSPGSDEETNDAEEDEKIKKSMIKEDLGQEFNSAKLRRYQLERLRYYYAVLTCSSIPIAQAIYDAVDGAEYLTTANFFDLRFIPDDVEFLDDKPRDECERIPDSYRPNEFVTDALQHSKVRLTWDADDGSRKEAQKRAFTGSRADIDENDLKAYLGSDSSGGEEPEPVIVDATVESAGKSNINHDAEEQAPKLSKKEAERQRMRALLGLQKEPTTSKKSKTRMSAPVGDMQITFSSGLSSEPSKGSVFENEPPRDETTAERYVRKERERKSRRKEKMKMTRNAASAVADDAPTETPPPTDADNPADQVATEDLGFDDPFFTAPSSKPPKPASSKAHRRTTEPSLDAPSRAELELLMLPENALGADAPAVQHFNMHELALAEKARLKTARHSHSNSNSNNKKKAKLSARERAATLKGDDDFRLDVADPRFGAVFERPEFAIDPSHPRFSGTGAMRSLLEEGRRKRGRGRHEEGEGGEGEGGSGEEVGRRGKKVGRRGG